MMDLPTTHSSELSQPTRARIFTLLSDLRRPAGTGELAEQLALHPNGVRIHLERLADAGLVVRMREKQARGRPRDYWSISPTANPGGDPPSGYAELGRWLVRAMAETGIDRSAIEHAGRKIGRDLAPKASGEPVGEQIFEALAALGFQPVSDIRGPGETSYCLGNCPYREAVKENQELICSLHRGMTEGLLDVLDGNATLTDFVAMDPDTAGCLIEVQIHGDKPAKV